LINDPLQKYQTPALMVIADAPTGLARAHGGGTGIHLSLTNDASTVIHEIGHTLEDQLLGTVALEKEFLAYRAKGEIPKKFVDLFPNHGYKPDEEGVQNEFGKVFGKDTSSAYYVGKSYANRSELLSMGLEELYTDGIEFANADPEYLKFVIGILHGAFQFP